MKDPNKIMERVSPKIPRDMRIALIEEGIAGSHKVAQELFVAPYLANVCMQNCDEILVPGKHDQYIQNLTIRERRPYFGV